MQLLLACVGICSTGVDAGNGSDRLYPTQRGWLGAPVWTPAKSSKPQAAPVSFTGATGPQDLGPEMSFPDSTSAEPVDDTATTSPASSRASRDLNPAEVERLVGRLAPVYELGSGLVLALIHAESSFKPDARSPKGAHGLMQLMPATAQRFGVTDIDEPIENLKGGMACLRWLMARFRGDVRLALAGYNAGEGAVRRYGGVPPYAETRAYVKKVMRRYGKAHHSVPSSGNQPLAVALGHAIASLGDLSAG
jgi:soluble lytic murein transglycosylase-like protein